MQTKWDSLKESFSNILIGYVVAILSQLAIFPLFGINLPLSDNLLIGLYFTVISLARSYVLRRFFNKKTVAKLDAKKQFRREFYSNYDVFTDVAHPSPQDHRKGVWYKLRVCTECRTVGEAEGILSGANCPHCDGLTKPFGLGLYDKSITAWLKRKEK